MGVGSGVEVTVGVSVGAGVGVTVGVAVGSAEVSLSCSQFSVPTTSFSNESMYFSISVVSNASSSWGSAVA